MGPLPRSALLQVHHVPAADTLDRLLEDRGPQFSVNQGTGHDSARIDRASQGDIVDGLRNIHQRTSNVVIHGHDAMPTANDERIVAVATESTKLRYEYESYRTLRRKGELH